MCSLSLSPSLSMFIMYTPLKWTYVGWIKEIFFPLFVIEDCWYSWYFLHCGLCWPENYRHFFFPLFIQGCAFIDLARQFDLNPTQEFKVLINIFNSINRRVGTGLSHTCLSTYSLSQSELFYQRKVKKKTLIKGYSKLTFINMRERERERLLKWMALTGTEVCEDVRKRYFQTRFLGRIKDCLRSDAFIPESREIC